MIFGTSSPLGTLNYLRIWHDNSGKRSYASWFLKFVIVHDLQTRAKYYFICEKWLALDRDEGVVDRILPVAGDKQKTNFRYLLEKQTTEKLRDGHLWFSIFARPTLSTFTRFDRLTCCFVLLYVTMLVNIMYYGVAAADKANTLDIGPMRISQTQVTIYFI